MLEKLKKLEEKYKEITGQLCDPAVINDMDRFKELSRQSSELEPVVELARHYRHAVENVVDAERMMTEESDPEMKAFLQQEQIDGRKKVEDLERAILLELLPKDPYAEKDIIMEIRQGAGGNEAALFAAELMRLYLKYAERKGYKSEILDINETELGGIKQVIISIKGRGAYSALKFESGVHRVQRVPATEASGRVHTSTVTVAVLPEAEEVDVEINPVDLRIDTFRASGAGGQHVNRTDSAVRLTHEPTGIVISCQDERSQHQNRDKAMRILRSKLLELAIRKQDEEIASSRKSQVGSGDRSEKIRTYNFPQSRLTDHRISMTIHNIENIMQGDIDDLIVGLQNREKEDMLLEVSR